jgi:hypothetical protein
MAEKLLTRETLPEKSPAQGHNDVFQQSHNQQSPRDAVANDFVILESDEAAAAEYVADGQHGRDETECTKIEKASASDRGKSSFRKQSK